MLVAANKKKTAGPKKKRTQKKKKNRKTSKEIENVFTENQDVKWEKKPNLNAK